MRSTWLHRRRATLSRLTPQICSTLWILASAGCGGSTDGQPVPPPTTPAPPTTPSPEPAVRTVRALVWLHSAPGTARGYYAGEKIVLIAGFDERVSVVDSPRLAIEVGEQVRHAVFSPWVEDDFPPERPSWRQRFVYEVALEDEDEDGISIAADAFDYSRGTLLDRSGTEIEGEIYAVATTRNSPDPVAPGEALASHRIAGPPEPRLCTNERELAINKGFASGVSPILVHEWSGEPFQFYWDASIPQDLRGHAENVFELVKRVSHAIRGQIGYSVLEVGGWVDEADRGFEFSEDNITRCEGWRHARRASVARAVTGKIVATVHPNELPHARAAARPHCGVIFWSAGVLDHETFTAATHEIFHLLGFVHSPYNPSQSQSPPGEGVHMSKSLSAGSANDLGGLTYDDIDALRCIFPKNGSPRS